MNDRDLAAPELIETIVSLFKALRALGRLTVSTAK
jgi:hypothetical protein